MTSNGIGNIFCVEKQFPKKVHAFFIYIVCSVGELRAGIEKKLRRQVLCLLGSIFNRTF